MKNVYIWDVEENAVSEKLLEIYQKFYKDIEELLKTDCLFREDVKIVMDDLNLAITQIPVKFSSILIGEKFKDKTGSIYMRVGLPGGDLAAIGLTGPMKGYQIRLFDQDVVRIQDE